MSNSPETKQNRWEAVITPATIVAALTLFYFMQSDLLEAKFGMMEAKFGMMEAKLTSIESRLVEATQEHQAFRDDINKLYACGCGNQQSGAQVAAY